MIRILCIDNNNAQLDFLNMYIKRLYEDVILVGIDYLPSLQFVDDFDGLIIDENLTGDTTGLGYALQVTKHNSMIPIMLYTDRQQVPKDAESIVDYVCIKENYLGFNSKLTCLLRQIQRLQELQYHVGISTKHRKPLQSPR